MLHEVLRANISVRMTPFTIYVLLGVKTRHIKPVTVCLILPKRLTVLRGDPRDKSLPHQFATGKCFVKLAIVLNTNHSTGRSSANRTGQLEFTLVDPSRWLVVKSSPSYSAEAVAFKFEVK